MNSKRIKKKKPLTKVQVHKKLERMYRELYSLAEHPKLHKWFGEDDCPIELAQASISEALGNLEFR